MSSSTHAQRSFSSVSVLRTPWASDTLPRYPDTLFGFLRFFFLILLIFPVPIFFCSLCPLFFTFLIDLTTLLILFSGSVNLVKAAEIYLQKSFVQVSESEEFLAIGFKEVNEIIGALHHSFLSGSSGFFF